MQFHRNNRRRWDVRLSSLSFYSSLYSLYAFSALCASSSPVHSQSPQAAALLRGAESARMAAKSLRSELTIEFISPEPSAVMECLVEQKGDRRRFEVFGEDNPMGGVVVVNGDEVHAFPRYKHADVRLCDMEYVSGVSGDLAFDLRTLGLNDLLTADNSVKGTIWSDKDAEVVGREMINGINAWRVRVKSPTVTKEYWIEEPSFRIHKSVTEWPQGKSVIESEFGDDKSPFPSLVRIKRDDPNGHMERTVRVKELEIDPAIEEDRFTLAAMGVPINTPVVDYRIQRRVGYWDGSGLSQDPVDVNKVSGPGPTSPSSSNDNRNWLIAINVVILLVLAIVIVWFRSRSAASSNSSEQ